MTANSFHTTFVPANRTDDLQLHDVYYNKNFKQDVRTMFDEWCVQDLLKEDVLAKNVVKVDFE